MKFSILAVSILLLSNLTLVRLDEYDDKVTYVKRLISIQDKLEADVSDLRNSNSKTIANS